MLIPVKNIESLADTHRSCLMNLIIQNFPGSPNISPDEFVIRCTGYEFPGAKLISTEADFGGYHISDPTQQDRHNDNWKVTVIEDWNARIHSACMKWFNFVHDPKTGIIAPRSSSKISATCQLIEGSTGKPSASVELIGLYLKEKPALKYSSSPTEGAKASSYDLTFSYDWFNDKYND